MGFIKFTPYNYPKICKNSAHTPPRHMVLEPGTYTWKCPECGKEQTFIVKPKPTL
jgi:hypothetical protein